jgi:chromosome segregation ATPase
MIESIMFFAGGFLVAVLLALVMISFVHHRAVRLTQRRLEDAIPVSMAEIQADKDNLRAEFAMSARRLEMNVEQLKAKTTVQLGEIARKSEAINQLKAELTEKTAVTDALDSQARSLGTRIRETEQEYGVRMAAVEANERALAIREAALAQTASEVEEKRTAHEAERRELAELRTQVEQFKAQIGELQQDRQQAAQRLVDERAAAAVVAEELEEKRQALGMLRPQLAQFEREIAVHVNELDNRGRRIDDLELSKREQARALAERQSAHQDLLARYDSEVATLHERRETEVGALRQERDTEFATLRQQHATEVGALRHDHEAEVAALRQAIAADRAEHGSRVERLQNDNTALDRLFAEARDTVTSHGDRIDDLESRLAEQDRSIRERNEKISALVDEIAAERRESDIEIERLQAELQSVEELHRSANQTLDWRADRIEELESQLAEHAELLRQCDAEIKTSIEEMVALKAQAAAATVHLEAEIAGREAQLKAAIEDDRRTQAELAALKQEAATTWKADRADIALLGERINDFAAQVAHMALAMDKSGQIDAILTQSHHGEPTDNPDGGAEAAHAGDLTSRIRKLRLAASRAAPAS